MRIIKSDLRQLIQEVIEEESLVEGTQDKRFEEFEDDVMEIGSDGGGQVEIKDLITRLSDKYNPDEIQNMISILVDGGTLTQLGDSEFFSIPDDRKIYQDDEPAWADTSAQGGISQQQYSDDLAMQGGPWYYEGDEEEELSKQINEEKLSKEDYNYWYRRGVKAYNDADDSPDELDDDGTTLTQLKFDAWEMGYNDAEEWAEQKWREENEQYHRYSEGFDPKNPNRPDEYNLGLVKTHRGALNVTAKLSDEEIEAAGPEKWDNWAFQIRQAKNIVALGEDVERMIREELTELLK
tara:strand:+ start:5681 stop:6562 length:882 start_codon:yes stop_codon:yes gene_type:complete